MKLAFGALGFALAIAAIVSGFVIAGMFFAGWIGSLVAAGICLILFTVALGIWTDRNF